MNEDGMKRAFLISLAGHAIVFAIFFVRAVFYPTEPLVLEDVIRVDMVALPDKMPVQNLPPAPVAEPVAQPKPEPEPVAQPKPVEAPKPVTIPKPDAPTVSFDKNKRKQQDAAIKKLEAMEKIKKMMEQEAANAKTSSPTVVKGNEISKGSALKGLARIEHENYLRTIDNGVKRHWNLPGWLANASLSARVRLFVDAQGNVIKKAITKSSGNDDYDSRVMATVDAATPLPAPPGSLVNVLAVDGIELEFVPK